MLLETKSLSKNFGGLLAVCDLELALANGEMLGLIGPNGSGKSTVLNLISGFIRPSRGGVFFGGRDITGLPAHVIASKGIARTFQIKNTFSGLSTEENMILALNLARPASVYGALASKVISEVRTEEEALVSRARAILHEIGLEGRAKDKASALPLAQEKFLSLGMAIAQRPKVLLLDEPVAGMNREEMKSFMSLVEQFARDINAGVILVEHTMAAVMNYCSRIVVINHGKQIACGTPDEIKSNPVVRKAYLGE